jgi:hypothetical protein
MAWVSAALPEIIGGPATDQNPTGTPQLPSMSSGSAAADCWLLGRLYSGSKGCWDPLGTSGSSISAWQPRTVFALPTHPQKRVRMTGKWI